MSCDKTAEQLSMLSNRRLWRRSDGALNNLSAEPVLLTLMEVNHLKKMVYAGAALPAPIRECYLSLARRRGDVVEVKFSIARRILSVV